MGAALGLDVGERRIGVALSDPTGVLASPLTTQIRADTRTTVAAIAQLAAEHHVTTIVVGVPLSDVGEDTAQSRRIRAFGYKLRAIPGVRVVFWDERYSTATAGALLAQGPAGREQAPAPRSARRREAARRRLDAAAAAVILQEYLDQERSPGSCA